MAGKPAIVGSKVEVLPIDDLVPYENNSRKHPDAQIEQIANSIRKFGFTMPILIDEAGTLIAGHGRLEAAKRLGMTEVPVIVARGWSEDDARAYTIADNRLAETSEWDKDLLRIEIEDLLGAGYEMDFLGFDDAAMAKIIAEQTDGEDANDPAKHWAGMPEFDQQDKSAFRSIPVHFKDQAGVDDFAKLIGQKITDKTRFVWFPEIEIETYADKRYSTDVG